MRIAPPNLLEDFPLGFLWSSYIAGLWLTVLTVRKIKRNFQKIVLKVGEVLGIIIVWVFTKVIVWYSYRFQQVNVKQKCPACGIIAKHKVYFDSDLKIAEGKGPGALVHECVRCECRYGQPTIVPVEKWFRVLKRDEAQS